MLLHSPTPQFLKVFCVESRGGSHQILGNVRLVFDLMLLMSF
ncbi:rCG52806, isoform CRA_a [Rattus norvegicus]|uniref:RCG52806, isoform CRA_a n=1 Tax=Rattus norvegicus TaxID=10116 RepID=A6IRM6_RAT|nr:rCG52806, isoform CRA_a [Rattus norvegicus]